MKMDPIDFVQKRKADIFAIEKEIFENSKKICKQPFQRLPRFLRRRAASHNTKRLPARFRRSENDGKNTHGKKSLRLKSTSHLLETFSWHSKRCTMGMKYGQRLPLNNNEKTMKHCVKAAKLGCFLYDMSYWSILSMGDTTLDFASGQWAFSKDDSGNHSIICSSVSCSFQLTHPMVLESLPNSNFTCFLLIGPKSIELTRMIQEKVFLFSNADFDSTLLLCHRQHSFSVWKVLIQNGCRVGAFSELRKVCIEHKIPTFPYDFASSSALTAVQKEVEHETELLNNTKTKAKYDHLFYKRLLDAIVKYQSLSHDGMQTCYFRVISKGRPTIYSEISDTENNCVGFLTTVDFSELHGMVCAIGCIKSGTENQEKFNCKSLHGHTYSLELVKKLL